MKKCIYVGADVHAAVTVLESQTKDGKVFSQAKVPTTVEALAAFLQGLPGKVHLTFEEGPQAEWLHEMLSPVVYRLLVCDPRRNAKKQGGNKSDKVDAHKLCTDLRTGELHPVFHVGGSIRELKQHVFSRDRLVQDSTRTKNRIRSVFRGRGIRLVEGKSFFALKYRDDWLNRLEGQPGEQVRAIRLFRQLDVLSELAKEAEADMLATARKRKAWRLVKTVPGIGQVRAAEIVAKVVTPHRFRTKKQFWQYCGFGVGHNRSDEYAVIDGQIRRRPEKVGQTRGLNRNHSPMLKRAFKGAAVLVAGSVFAEFMEKRLSEGMRVQMARLTLARKLAAITLAIWKKGERFDIDKALTSR